MNIARSIPLSGGDFFTLAMEHAMSRVRTPGNICRVIMQLDGHLDPASLMGAIERSGLKEWISNARWSRPLPLMVPRWKVKGGRKNITIETHRVPDCDKLEKSLPRAVRDKRVSPFRPPGFAFDLLDHPSGKSSLVFTWHHALMDARGAEMFLSLIGAGASKTYDSSHNRPVAASPPPTLVDGLKSWLKFPARATAARNSIHDIARSCRLPIASIINEDTAGLGKKQLFHIISFDSEQTGQIKKKSVLAGAKFRDSIFYLAATLRSINKILLHRRAEPAPYLVPVPQDSRKRGSLGPLISNHFSFLFYRVEPKDMASLESLIKTLNKQMQDQIRKEIPTAFLTTMELFRMLPIGLFALQASGPTKGQMASFFFSFTGDSFTDLEEFMDLQVRNITHLPSVSLPPGLSVAFTNRAGRLSSILSYIEGCLDSRELDMFESSLRSELLEHAN